MSEKKKIREKFRNEVFTRDKNKCRMCESPAVDSHHITDRTEIINGGYCKENGIALCAGCHVKAERFHITQGKEWEKGFHPDELYAIIGSSRILAFEKAKNIAK